MWSFAQMAHQEIGRAHVCTLLTPISTLFPYTTLFRSLAVARGRVAPGAGQRHRPLRGRAAVDVVVGAHGPPGILAVGAGQVAFECAGRNLKPALRPLAELEVVNAVRGDAAG